MRKKKQEKVREEQFWNGFFYFNVPKHLDTVPEHLEHVKFRLYNVDDYGLSLMAEYVKTINMLDLDGTDVTNEGILHLTYLEWVKELRLKECVHIDDRCIEYLNKVRGLEFIHFGGTAVTTDGILKLFIPGLKRILIRAEHDEDTKAKLSRFHKAFPNCELTVNYKSFEDYLAGEG